MDSNLPKVAYSMAETTFITSLKKTSLYKHARDGSLRLTRVGRRTVVLHDDLMAFLRNRGNG
ncbi:DNA-binding protein (plasmid) [Azospirillum argentinense]|uniref:DNA-binding protein n=1 Tax=Azospirillum argentinense TaxID=2970906 RepID=A0A4D8PED8_9PROT|nr:helix-turn-helix domain-containing protein [Azospirillum argentinense]QCN97063.1 DNA-binding protein [Azospirillum argentinense]